jgi:hypothetical protein
MHNHCQENIKWVVGFEDVFLSMCAHLCVNKFNSLNLFVWENGINMKRVLDTIM